MAQVKGTIVIGELSAAETVNSHTAMLTFDVRWPTPGIEWQIGAKYAITFERAYERPQGPEKVDALGETLGVAEPVARPPVEPKE